MRRAAALAAALLLLGGCRMELREADMLTIVSGMGIDGAPGGRELTIEVSRPDSAGDKMETVLVESRGSSLIEGMKESVSLTGRRLYFTHTDVLVLGRETAEQGVLPLLEALIRQNELPLTVRMLVSEGEAREIFKADALMDEIKSREIKHTLTSNSLLAEAPEVSLFKFAGRVLEAGVDGFLPLVRLAEIDGQPTQEVQGAALFAGDTLACTIDKSLTQCLLWAAGFNDTGVLSKDGNAFTATNVRVKTTADPGGAEISMSMDVFKSEGELSESESVQFVRALVESHMKRLLDLTRQHGCDPLGLGREIKRRNLAGWRTLETDWPEKYKDYEIDFNIDVRYISSGRAE